jgi:hypothetical protein
VIAWIAWLAVKPRGLAPIAAANPGIPGGGVVGESKFDILSALPAEWTIPAMKLAAGAPDARADALADLMRAQGWTFPLILKPDVGQRGDGVRKVMSVAEARAWLDAFHGDAIAQPWHPGPFEAGIFYYRLPDEPHGHILSITDKQFPVVTGDGVRPIERLVLDHPRFSHQAPVFLDRHAESRSRVLAAGERFVLGEIGNHCKGTLFRGGAHLWTPALEARVDAIARAMPGFFIGRFDVRYTDVERFKAGEDLAIVELNGVTGEPTDVYDPSRGVIDSYRGLFTQWRLVFEIGAANLAREPAAGRTLRLVRQVIGHLAS